MNRETRILLALLQMTVARGCTPEEAKNARAKAEIIAVRTGISLAEFEARHAQPAFSGTRPDWAQEAWRKAEERREQRRAEEREAQRREAAEAEKRERARRAAARPANKRLLDLLRYGGLTDDELGFRLGLKPHTVRATISRLRKAGVEIKSVRSGGTVLYAYFD